MSKSNRTPTLCEHRFRDRVFVDPRDDRFAFEILSNTICSTFRRPKVRAVRFRIVMVFRNIRVSERPGRCFLFSFTVLSCSRQPYNARAFLRVARAVTAVTSDVDTDKVLLPEMIYECEPRE